MVLRTHASLVCLVAQWYPLHFLVMGSLMKKGALFILYYWATKYETRNRAVLGCGGGGGGASFLDLRLATFPNIAVM